MALRDRRNERAKVDPSAAQKMVTRGLSNMYQGAANFADNYLGGAGVRQIGRGINTAVNTLSEDAANTRSAVAATNPPTIQDPPMRTTPFQPPTQDNTQASAQPTQTGLRAAASFTNAQGQTTPIPGGQPSNLASYGPNSGYIRNEETGDTVGMVGGNMRMFDRDGNVIEVPTQRFSTAQPAAGTGQTDDVIFDPSVSPEQRQAFLQQPTQPGTRMRSGLRQPGEMSEREKYFARNQARRGGSAGVSLAEGVGIDGFVPVGLNSGFSREGRNARNQTRMVRALRENADRDLARETAQLQAQTPITVAGLRESGATARQLGVNAINREGNLLDYTIDQQNANSLGGLRGSTIALNQANTAEVGPNAAAQRRKDEALADAAGIIKLPVRRDIDGSVTRTDVYRADGDNIRNLNVPVPRTMEGFIDSQIAGDPAVAAAWREKSPAEQQELYQEWLAEQGR